MNKILIYGWIRRFVLMAGWMMVCWVPAHSQTRCGVIEDANSRRMYWQWRQLLKQTALERREVLTIPVVVHVVYHTPEENIDDRQIRSQIDALNRAFSNPGDFNASIPWSFVNLRAIPGIHFCLADRDASGAPSTGITRTFTPQENIGLLFGESQRRIIHYSHLGGQDAWDPARYFNIWIGSLGGLLGRANVPGTDYYPEEDGIVIAPQVFGTTGTVRYPFHQGKTAVHETGHYLGLAHLWGMESDDCSEDDGLADTPLQAGPYAGCPPYPQESCGSEDLFIDYMDFVDDECLLMFTRDQVDLMRSTLLQYRTGLLTGQTCDPNPSWSAMEQALYIVYRPDRKQLEVVWRHPGEAVFEIRIWDVAGRLVVHQKGYAFDPWIIPVNQWVTGIYFAETIAPGNQLVQKVLIY